jgi:uncharacterized protein with von Willebrand factor type A (vWA) domain
VTGPGSTSVATPEAVLVDFVGDLRRAGLTVPVGSTVRFAEAVALVGAADERSVYWAGRATLVPHPGDRDDHPAHGRRR